MKGSLWAWERIDWIAVATRTFVDSGSFVIFFSIRRYSAPRPRLFLTCT